MVEFRIIMDLQIQMLLLAGIGFLLTKIGFIGKASRQGLINISLYVVVPCNIIRSFETEFSVSIMEKLAAVLLIAAGVQVFGVLLSMLLYRKMEDGRRRILSYGTMVSNQGFMGLPVIDAMLGGTGLLYASIALIPLRIVMWSVALAQFTKTDGKKTMLRMITHPCMIAVAVGLVIMLTGFRIPGILGTTVDSLSGCILPLVMIALGSIVADSDFKHVISRDIVYFTLVRLVLIPGIVLMVLKLCSVDYTITAVTLIFAGMPAATTTAILAESYGLDSLFASKCVLVTTMFSLVTVPMWLIIL